MDRQATTSIQSRLGPTFIIQTFDSDRDCYYPVMLCLMALGTDQEEKPIAFSLISVAPVEHKIPRKVI